MKIIFLKLQFFAGLVAGKLVFTLLHMRGSRGTALPGLITEKICPGFIELSRNRLGKVIAITGTNGKTSTQTLLAHCLKGLSDKAVLVNSRGANLKRGLISELIKGFDLFGDKSYEFSIFEVEEATLPKITAELKPDFLVVTNFFRDQLDAYGEIDRTKSHVAKAISQLGEGAVVIANGDDPQVLDTLRRGKNLSAIYLLVKIEDFQNYLSYEPSPAEIELDNIDTSWLNYPKAQVNADLGLSFELGGQEYQLQLPGYYSYYSFAFSETLLSSLKKTSAIDYTAQQLATLVASCKPAFGRGEIIKINSQRSVRILLIKNPVGFNLALEMLTEIKTNFSLSILINDKIADGRDVSWLWDSSLEKINKLNLSRVMCAGQRSKDMLLRLKYALDDSASGIKISEPEDIDELIDWQLAGAGQEIVLATYTAMNHYRDTLLAKLPETN